MDVVGMPSSRAAVVADDFVDEVHEGETFVRLV